MILGHTSLSDRKKHVGGIMLVIVLVKSVNYGRSGNREIQVKGFV